MRISIGADPEVFVVNRIGEYVSAHNMIPGTKERPYKVKDGAVQVDGMALEYNIEPCYSVNTFIRRNTSVLKQLGAMLPAGHKLAINPVARFGQDLIAAQPFEARQLGCEPDYNAYTLQHNPAPNPNGDYRTAAGHIHIGFTKDMDVTDPHYLAFCAQMVKLLDGRVFQAALYNETKDDALRRGLYGQRGAFRPKTYGLEYRPLSNFWLKSPKLMEWVYNSVMQTVTSGGKAWWNYIKEPPR